MKITKKEWILFILLAIFCFLLWFKFWYPRLSFVHLVIDKKEAFKLAESYLLSLGVDTDRYTKIIVFENDEWADRYLQKTMGIKKENEFIDRYNYELFFWKVRFFRQFQKEEYIVKVSPKSGEIIEYSHLIEDVESRITQDEDIARHKAKEFLETTFGINLKDYEFHEVKIKRYEKRIDYSFSWERKDVYIPWQNGQGGAKLFTAATISGDEIRRFYKNKLDTPEKFHRYIERQIMFGQYLLSFYKVIFAFIVASSIAIVIKKRNYVLTRSCKKWYLSLAIFLITIYLISVFNNLQFLLINYSTSASLASYIGIHLIQLIFYILLFNVAFIMIGIAGETLRKEVLDERKYSSFIHYIRTTFYSMNFAQAIIFGYLLFFILLGLQAALFYLGQKYLGVWKEWYRFTEFSSAYIPFLSAFAIGATASLNEEVFFRLFAISWGKKYLKNLALAIFFAAIIWGFGHSGYMIFPVWFRGIEVSILGLLYGVIFIKYGLIPVIVAHYLFDVFWGIAAYILFRGSAYLFTGSIFVFIIPLFFALAAYILNREEKAKEIKIALNKIQKYNLGVLISFISAKKSQGLSLSQIRNELIEHNWDIELIDLATKEVFKTQ